MSVHWNVDWNYEKLKNFQEKEKIFSLDINSSLLLADMMKFESEYNNTLIAIDIINENEKFINKNLTDDEKELSKKVSSTINERLSALTNEISILEVERISTIKTFFFFFINCSTMWLPIYPAPPVTKIISIL